MNHNNLYTNLGFREDQDLSVISQQLEELTHLHTLCSNPLQRSAYDYNLHNKSKFETKATTSIYFSLQDIFQGWKHLNEKERTCYLSCNVCHGHKYLMENKCVICTGKGKVFSKQALVGKVKIDCPGCNGIGSKLDLSKSCYRCAGQGKVKVLLNETIHFCPGYAFDQLWSEGQVFWSFSEEEWTETIKINDDQDILRFHLDPNEHEIPPRLFYLKDKVRVSIHILIESNPFYYWNKSTGSIELIKPISISVNEALSRNFQREIPLFYHNDTYSHVLVKCSSEKSNKDHHISPKGYIKLSIPSHGMKLYKQTNKQGNFIVTFKVVFSDLKESMNNTPSERESYKSKEVTSNPIPETEFASYYNMQNIETDAEEYSLAIDTLNDQIANHNKQKPIKENEQEKDSTNFIINYLDKAEVSSF